MHVLYIFCSSVRCGYSSCVSLIFHLAVHQIFVSVEIMVYVSCIQVIQSTGHPVTINSPFVISVTDGSTVTSMSDQEFVRTYSDYWREMLVVLYLYGLPHTGVLYSRCVRFVRNNRDGIHLPDVVPEQ